MWWILGLARSVELTDPRDRDLSEWYDPPSPASCESRYASLPECGAIVLKNESREAVTEFANAWHDEGSSEPWIESMRRGQFFVIQAKLKFIHVVERILTDAVLAHVKTLLPDPELDTVLVMMVGEALPAQDPHRHMPLDKPNHVTVAAPMMPMRTEGSPLGWCVGTHIIPHKHFGEALRERKYKNLPMDKFLDTAFCPKGRSTGIGLNIGDIVVYDSRTLHWSGASQKVVRNTLYVTFKQAGYEGKDEHEYIRGNPQLNEHPKSAELKKIIQEKIDWHRYEWFGAGTPLKERVDNAPDVPPKLDELNVCAACLATSKDYCVESNSCTKRGVPGCKGPEDQVTKDIDLRMLGGYHSTCPGPKPEL